MWEISVEAPVDQVYRELKREFDAQHVEKQSYEFSVNGRRGSRTFTKDRAIIDDQTSLQFRLLLKAVQPMLALYSDAVAVTLGGNEDEVNLKIEAR